MARNPPLAIADTNILLPFEPFQRDQPDVFHRNACHCAANDRESEACRRGWDSNPRWTNAHNGFRVLRGSCYPVRLVLSSIAKCCLQTSESCYKKLGAQRDVLMPAHPVMTENCDAPMFLTNILQYGQKARAGWNAIAVLRQGHPSDSYGTTPSGLAMRRTRRRCRL